MTRRAPWTAVQAPSSCPPAEALPGLTAQNSAGASQQTSPAPGVRSPNRHTRCPPGTRSVSGRPDRRSTTAHYVAGPRPVPTRRGGGNQNGRAIVIQRLPREQRTTTADRDADQARAGHGKVADTPLSAGQETEPGLADGPEILLFRRPADSDREHAAGVVAIHTTIVIPAHNDEEALPYVLEAVAPPRASLPSAFRWPAPYRPFVYAGVAHSQGCPPSPHA